MAVPPERHKYLEYVRLYLPTMMSSPIFLPAGLGCGVGCLFVVLLVLRWWGLCGVFLTKVRSKKTCQKQYVNIVNI